MGGPGHIFYFSNIPLHILFISLPGCLVLSSFQDLFIQEGNFPHVEVLKVNVLSSLGELSKNG